MRLERTQVTWSQLRVGIFALVCFCVLLAAALFTGSGLKSVRNRFTVHTILDTATGLKPGNPVRLAGVEVGEVKKIDFVHHDGTNKVRIQLNINQKAAKRLLSDSVVQIKSIGFTESRYVEISLGTAKGVAVMEGITLAGSVPVDMPIVLGRAIEVSKNMSSFLSRFESLLDRMQSGDGTFAKLLLEPSFYTTLNQATNGISDLVGELKDGRGLFPQLLSEEQFAEDVKQSAVWTAEWGQQLTQGKGTLGKLSTDPALFDRAERVLRNLETLEARLDRIDAVVAATDVLIQKVGHGEGTAAQMVNNPDLYNQAHASVEKIGQFVEQAQSDDSAVGKLVSDPVVAEQIAASTASVAELTKKLNTPGSTIDRLATSSDLLDHLLATTNQLESILTKINKGKGSLSRLTNDEETAEELSQLIVMLKALTVDIQAHPKKYVEFNLF